MATVEQNDGRTVQLKGVNLAFTDRLKTAAKTSPESPKETHGCSVVLVKSSPNYEANHAKVMSAIKAAGKVAFKDEDAYIAIAEDAPKRVCYRDGSKWKNKEGKIYAGFEDAKAFSGSGPSGGAKRPKLLDRLKREVAVEDITDVCYGGTKADVIVSFYGNDKGSRGIFCSIEAIRSHQEGERIGGGVHVDADDFDDLEDTDSFEKALDL